MSNVTQQLDSLVESITCQTSTISRISLSFIHPFRSALDPLLTVIAKNDLLDMELKSIHPHMSYDAYVASVNTLPLSRDEYSFYQYLKSQSVPRKMNALVALVNYMRNLQLISGKAISVTDNKTEIEDIVIRMSRSNPLVNAFMKKIQASATDWLPGKMFMQYSFDFEEPCNILDVLKSVPIYRGRNFEYDYLTIEGKKLLGKDISCISYDSGDSDITYQ